MAALDGDGELIPNAKGRRDVTFFRRVVCQGECVALLVEANPHDDIKMDTTQSWYDFHFLNNTFQNVSEVQSKAWINPSLVRLSYRGRREQSEVRSAKALVGLSLEYAAPFPLTYMFHPQATQIYCSIFVLLLQIRRAKCALERILVRGSASNTMHLGSGQKVCFAMRSKLSWFVK